MPFADPAKAKANKAAYYLKNREKLLERVKANAEKNRDAINARMSEYSKTDAVKARARERRAADPEKYRELDRKKRAKDIARARELDAARYQRDKDKIKARANVFRVKNPEKRADAQQRRRALKAGAPIERVLRNEILLRDGPNCAFCGIETSQPVHKKSNPKDRHYDHIIPLSRGGAHSMGNMRILCATCNCGKKSRLDCELSPSFVTERIGAANAGH